MKKKHLAQPTKATAGGVRHEESIPNHYHFPVSPDKEDTVDE